MLVTCAVVQIVADRRPAEGDALRLAQRVETSHPEIGDSRRRQHVDGHDRRRIGPCRSVGTGGHGGVHVGVDIGGHWRCGDAQYTAGDDAIERTGQLATLQWLADHAAATLGVTW